MSQASSEAKRTVRYIYSIVLALLGIAIFFGWISLSPNEAWFPWILTVFGLTIIFLPDESRKQVGATVTGLGFYLLLRKYDLLTLPVLQYFLGGFLIAVGVVNIIRNSKGGESEQKQTHQ